MRWIVYLIVVVAAVSGALIVGATDQAAMLSCQADHSFDVCFHTIYR